MAFLEEIDNTEHIIYWQTSSHLFSLLFASLLFVLLFFPLSFPVNFEPRMLARAVSVSSFLKYGCKTLCFSAYKWKPKIRLGLAGLLARLQTLLRLLAASESKTGCIQSYLFLLEAQQREFNVRPQLSYQLQARQPRRLGARHDLFPGLERTLKSSDYPAFGLSTGPASSLCISTQVFRLLLLLSKQVRTSHMHSSAVIQILYNSCAMVPALEQRQPRIAVPACANVNEEASR